MVKKILFIIILAFGSVFPLAAGSPGDKPKAFDLTILHYNDFHGYDYDNLARMETAIKEIRTKEKNVLLLNAGDTFTRGPHHHDFYGTLEFDIFNAQATDALVLGNNEFKATSNFTTYGHLKKLIAQAKFPILAANVKEVATGALIQGTEAYTIITKDGVRIGILGLTTPDSVGCLAGPVLDFQDDLKIGTDLYDGTAKQSDIVIALTHIGIDQDILLAKKLPGLAAIVGGHSHTLLKTPTKRGSIPIVQAGDCGKYLGRLDLHLELINGKWIVKSFNGKLLPVNTYAPDSEIQAIVKRYMQSLEFKAAS